MELREIRPAKRPGAFAEGTLACPQCDVPVTPPGGRAPLSAAVTCPYCGRAGRLRDFLSLELPTRPTRVCLRVRQPPPTPVTRRAPT
jgi:hypothetical protein